MWQDIIHCDITVFLKSNFSQPLKMYMGSLGFIPFGAAVSSNQAPCKCCSVPASTPPFGLISVGICWQQKIAIYGFPCIWVLHWSGAEAWEKGHVSYLHNCVQRRQELGQGPWHRLLVLDQGGSSWVWATSHGSALTPWRSHSRRRGIKSSYVFITSGC